MRTLQTVALVAATVGAGLMAGLFGVFACAVMPALARLDDRGFVQAMQHINREILNGFFLTPFLLPLPLLCLAVFLSAKGQDAGALPWIVAALALYAVAFLVTGTRNVPLNNALDAVSPTAGDGPLGAARAAFEGPWVAWNTVRALLHTGAFGCLVWALRQAPGPGA
ncbi:DUF1772 domain-containing protein [Streptomyces sp. URMC 123]|uniref:anthrone oxygenase family protein n=1 Tax=Streptomyces sp. URMC 123 TaxID=3423403 RepID=UPI003F196C7D